MYNTQITTKIQTNYTLFLLATSFLGVQLIYIDTNILKLSPYRFLIILAPLLLMKWYKESFPYLRGGINYSYFMFLLFWAFYSLSTALLVADVAAWLKYNLFFISGIISSIFIGLFFTKKEDFIKAFRIIEILSIFLGIIGYYEIFTGNYNFISQDNQDWYFNALNVIGYRIPITIFYNPNDYALFCLFSFYISLILFMTQTNHVNRLISCLNCISLIFLLIATQSRGGFVALLISAPFVIYSFYRLTNIGHRLWIAISALFILIVERSGWLFYIYGDVYSSLTTFDLAGGDVTRINLIKNGLIFLKDSYYLGTGLGNIEYHMGHSAVYYVGWIRNIHNWWMEILVSSGVLIFAIYVYLYIRNVWLLYKLPKITCDREVALISIPLLGFTTAFVVSSMSSSSHFTSEWLWPSVALIYAFVNYAYNAESINNASFSGK